MDEEQHNDDEIRIMLDVRTPDERTVPLLFILRHPPGEGMAAIMAAVSLTAEDVLPAVLFLAEHGDEEAMKHLGL